MKTQVKTIVKAILVGIGMCAAAYGFVISGLWNRVAISSTLVYPILVCENALVKPIKSFFQRRKNENELRVELENIRKERNALSAEVSGLKTLIAYHHDVDELIEFKARYLTEKARVCQIISKQIDAQQHSILVDAGSRKGVKVDMVAVYNNAIVGRVSEVYPLYCKIVLATDARCKIGALEINTKACGIYCGKNTLNVARLEQVSHLSNVAQNDTILSSGEGLIFPRGFSLGTIKTYSKNGLFYDIELQPSVDINVLEYCLLIDHDGAYLNTLRNNA